MALKQRVITAAIAIPVIVLIILYAGTLLFAALLTGFISIGAWEWAGLCGWQGKHSRFIYSAVIFIFLFTCFIFRHTLLAGVVVYLAAIVWIGLAAWIMLQQSRKTLSLGNRLVKSAVGAVVLVPAWLSLVVLHNSNYYGAGYVIFLLALVWLADSAAYFAGHLWGKHKLASIISPGKTWEGGAGAMLAAAGAGLIFALATGMQVPDIIMFSIVCMVTVAGSVVGDLTESLVKRTINVKDSGNVFPGHGGVMDRIDSLTAAAPIFLAGMWLVRALHESAV